jgi:hypothetical protein
MKKTWVAFLMVLSLVAAGCSKPGSETGNSREGAASAPSRGPRSKKIEMNKMMGLAVTAADPKLINTTDPY